MVLQRIQTVVVTLTTIGVWSNLYINYHTKDGQCKRHIQTKDSK